MKRESAGKPTGGRFAKDTSGAKNIPTASSLPTPTVSSNITPSPPVAVYRLALINKVRSVFPQCENLRKPAYKGNPIPSAGHCYIASELIYHALGGKEAGWTPNVLTHENSTHWFLRHTDGTILDPTSDQFSTPVPYEQGKGCGFLTKQPSKRCVTLASLAGIPLGN